MKKIKRYLNILAIATVGLCTTFAFAGDKTVEEGEADSAVWSGYYWPLYKGEIVEPLAKYDSVSEKKAADWERTNNRSGKDVPEWFGYCHGWSAAAIMELEPTQAVSYRGRTFEVGDQKALLTASHAADVANVYGRRFRGAEGDDLNDIRPEDLWTVLRRYLGEQGVPIVVDFEPNEQVWNNPVFRYRVEYEIKNDVCVGKMTLWYAGGAADPNFVGLKVKRAEFDFSIKATDGLVEYGTGKWLGESEKTHPDFAWSPFVARPESPEIDYRLVKQILKGDAATSEEQDSQDDATQDSQNVVAQNVQNVAAQNSQNVAAQNVQSVVEPQKTDVFPNISVDMAIALLRDSASDWNFDVGVDRGDGSYYEAGSSIVVSGVSEQDGYLYLFGIGPDNDLYALYPLAGIDNRVKANQEFQIPGDKQGFHFKMYKPYGRYRIHAFVSQKPIEFELTPAVSPKALKLMFKQWEDFKVTFAPTLEQLVAQKLSLKNTAREEKALKELKNQLGGFAQDEVVFVLLDDENMKQLNEMSEEDETDATK